MNVAPKAFQEKGTLENRRNLLLLLIKSLQDELNDIDAQLRKLHAPRRKTLTQEVFLDVVAPALISAGEKGLTTSELHEALDRMGINVGRAQLRVFLSRARKRGLLDWKPTKGRGGSWKLKS